MQSVKELGGSKLKELLIVNYDSYFWRTFENFTFLTTPDFTTLKKKLISMKYENRIMIELHNN
jgi:hypothetical protein